MPAAATPTAPEMEPSAPEMDTRVVVDISGSMKKNDPGNQRRGALRLLAELLPEGSKAGVWTFGQYVNMQVKHGTVDKAWKRAARAGAQGIHSRGMFTNIEKALRTAAAGLHEPENPVDRHLILLTDGMVDVSKDATKNAQSRARIEKELVPWMGGREIKVHTVALSARADHELLRLLARTTGGRYIDTKQADDLKRVFFRLFEAAAAPDTLPLKENKFQVDSRIKEMTVLVFHPADASPTQLLDPEGKAIDRETAPPDKVKWVAEKDFDLVTLSGPRAGEWAIRAATDPDNRVMVVTDLTLRVKPLPVYSLPGRRPQIDSELHFKEPLVSAGELFELVTVTVSHIPPDGVSIPNQTLAAEAQTPSAKDGVRRFSGKLKLELAQGEHEFLVQVDGKSFSRQKRLQTHASWPIRLAVQGTGVPSSVSVTTDAAWVRTDDMRISAVLLAPDGSREPTAFTPDSPGAGLIKLPPLAQTGEYQLEVGLDATTHAGAALSLQLPPLSLVGATPQPEPRPPTPIAQTPPPEPAQPDPQPEQPDWLRAGAIAAAFNLIVALVGLAVWYWRKRRGASAPYDDPLTGEL